MTQSLPELESLDLSNNFFGDITLQALFEEEVFSSMKSLKNIDVSANKLTDMGISSFFENFVHSHGYLKQIKLSYNKIKVPKTGSTIQEALGRCPNLRELSFKKCGISLEIFKEMVPGIQNTHEILEFCSNKLTNGGLKMLNEHILTTMYGNCELERLSLYDNDLQGKEAVDDMKMLLSNLPKLKTLNIESNPVFLMDGLLSL